MTILCHLVLGRWGDVAAGADVGCRYLSRCDGCGCLEEMLLDEAVCTSWGAATGADAGMWPPDAMDEATGTDAGCDQNCPKTRGVTSVMMWDVTKVAKSSQT